MSYRIEYEPQKKKYYPPIVKKGSNVKLAVWTVCLLSAIIVYYLNGKVIHLGWNEMIDNTAVYLRNNTAFGQAAAESFAALKENAKIQ